MGNEGRLKGLETAALDGRANRNRAKKLSDFAMVLGSTLSYWRSQPPRSELLPILSESGSKTPDVFGPGDLCSRAATADLR